MKGYGIEGLTKFNPNAALWAEQVNPDIILVTHGHGDHFGQTIEIIKRTGATLIASTKICTYLKSKFDLIECFPIEPGKRLTLHGVSIKAVGARHRFDLEGFLGDLIGTLNYNQYIPCGTNMGYVIEVEDTRIYHSGDTKKVAEVEDVDIAFLSMDGFRTMNYLEVLEGIRKICPKIAIPIHYKWNSLGEKTVESVQIGLIRDSYKSMFIPLENGEILK